MFCCIQKIEESGKGCQFSGVLDKRDFQDHVTFDFTQFEKQIIIKKNC